MSKSLSPQRRAIGIVIGSAKIVSDAGGTAGAEPWSRALESPAPNSLEWPSLARALGELRETVRGRDAELVVALLSPLAELRPVTLPPLAADAARQAIARNAGRYFLAGHEPQVIGVVAAAPLSRGESRTWIAAAAPVRILEAIHAAARDAGWTLRLIVPAEAAWRAAALTIWPSLLRNSHEVTVAMPDRTEVLQLEEGVLAGVRRFPGQGGSVSARHGDSPLIAPARWSALLRSPELTAATFAKQGSTFELVSESVRRLRQARRGRLAMGTAAVAVLLLVGAAGLELWGVRRELAHVAQERAALRPRVATLAATRELAIASRERLDELAAANRTAVSWSDVLLTLVHTLPREAHLVALRASGDSLVLEGLATSAAQVFGAIESASEFTGVQSAAPVRRDLRERAGPVPPERFSIAARIRTAPTVRDSALALNASGERP